MSQDELAEILKRTHQRAIEATRPTDREAVEQRENLLRAVSVVSIMLADHQWHKRSRVMTVCKANRVSFITIAEACTLAESKTGYYVAIVDEETPTEAPDEI